MLRVQQNLDALEPHSLIFFMSGTKMDSHQDNVNFMEISSLTSFSPPSLLLVIGKWATERV